jgi:ABC-type uncharacterized transport system involved in gliding motility auxiliary subunit
MKKSRLTSFRANIAILVIIVLGVMALINYLSYKHNKRFDTTAVGKYSLSEQTIKLLKSLTDELQITMFDKPGTEKRIKAEELLPEYEYYSDKVKTQYIDPDKNPVMAKKYGIQLEGTMVLGFHDRQQHVEKITEEALTNTIIKLTKGTSKKIYFLTGHGEADIEEEAKMGYSLLGQALVGQNYETQKLLLMQEARVPDDCTLLVVAGPKKDLMKEEKQTIENYITYGGKAFFLLDPVIGDTKAIMWDEFLARWGITVGNDIIIDTMSQLFGGDYFVPVINKYGNHPITRDFKPASFFPLLRSISLAEDVPDNVTLHTLASTSSKNSWAETRLGGPYEYTEGEDRLGPVGVGIAAEIKPDNNTDKTKKPATEGRLVVFGDSDFANNGNLYYSGNRDLFLNVISWLVEEEDLISIRPKSDIPRTISLTGQQMQAVFYLSVLLLPALGLIAGISVWIRRRKL